VGQLQGLEQKSLRKHYVARVQRRSDRPPGAGLA